MQALVICADPDFGIEIARAAVDTYDIDLVYAADFYDEAAMIFDDGYALRAIFIYVDVEDDVGSDAYSCLCDEFPELLQKVVFICKEGSGLLNSHFEECSITLPVTVDKIELALEQV